MVEDYIPYLQGECRQMDEEKDEKRPGKYSVYIYSTFCSHRNCDGQSKSTLKI